MKAKRKKFDVIEGGNEHEQKAQAAVSALMRGDDARFQEIYLSMPSPPRLSSVDAQPELPTVQSTPGQSSSDKT